MKWRGRRESDNVRKTSSSRGRGPIVGGLSGSALLLILVVSLVTGTNPLDFIGQFSGDMGQTSNSNVIEYQSRNREESEIEDFLSVVLADTEDVWHEIFNKHGARYKEPKLNLYQDNVNTGCGFASSNMGPFYCGADETVYIDVAFAKDLKNTFQASGDFPFAYVLAHEVGHHVQKQTGVLEQVQSLRGKVPAVEFNNMMVKMELQADYYAGVFAHYAKNKGYLDVGDIEEGMSAASGVGDDRIQEMNGGKANPDTFQHGTSAQRQEWFLRGVKYGDLENGNTFELVQ